MHAGESQAATRPPSPRSVQPGTTARGPFHFQTIRDECLPLDRRREGNFTAEAHLRDGQRGHLRVRRVRPGADPSNSASAGSIEAARSAMSSAISGVVTNPKSIQSR